MRRLPRPPSDKERAAIVEAALRGDGPLEALFAVHVFGKHDPDDDTYWPRPIFRAFMDAVREYERREALRRLEPVHLSISQIWDGIARFSHHPLSGPEWWRIPHLGWSALADHLDVTPRQLQGDAAKLGFLFRGRFAKRELVRAPCEGCGISHPVQHLEERRCVACH